MRASHLKRRRNSGPWCWFMALATLGALFLCANVLLRRSGPTHGGRRSHGGEGQEHALNAAGASEKLVAVVVFAPTVHPNVVEHIAAVSNTDAKLEVLVVTTASVASAIREQLAAAPATRGREVLVQPDDLPRSASLRESVTHALSSFPSATHVFLSSTSRRPVSPGFTDSLLTAIREQEWAAATCTSVFKGHSGGYVVEDMGLDAAEGSLGMETVPFVLRRFHGLPQHSHKLQGTHFADFITPHCAMFHRTVASLLTATADGVDVALPDTSQAETWVMEPSTRLHFLGLAVLNIFKLRGRPTAEEGAAISQVDNFRRDVIPKLKQYALRFGNVTRLVARLDVPEWRPSIVDNSTASIQDALLSQVHNFMVSYRRFLQIDLDAGALSGDLLLLKLSHQIRKMGGHLFAIPAFAAVEDLAMTSAVRSLVDDYGFARRSASTPLAEGPLLPKIPNEVAIGSFRGGEVGSASNNRVFVVWDTVCCGCCGFSSEIMHFLHPLRQLRRVRVTVSRDCFCAGYDDYVSDNVRRMHIEPAGVSLIAPPSDIMIWLSHAGPWSYYNHELIMRRPDYFIGRSMYEFTKIPKQWVAQIKPINEVWVPGKWVRDVFVANGVDANKIVVMPEAIDVEYFDPMVRGKVSLPLGGAESSWNRFCNGPGSADNFKFFSNFKWEPRKGWDVLFEAYFRGFNREDSVSLYVLTNVLGTPIANVSEIEPQFERWAKSRGLSTDMSTHPHFCVITEIVPEETIGDLYNSADAFVLPTRGEGWGLPTIQAMALGKPTISTAWGGQMEFMSRETSFLIELDGLEEIPEDTHYGYDLGKKWAVPSVRHTAELMRYVTVEREHAAEVGRRARAHIVAHFSEEAVALLADKRFHEVEAWIRHLRGLKK